MEGKKATVAPAAVLPLAGKIQGKVESCSNDRITITEPVRGEPPFHNVHANVTFVNMFSVTFVTIVSLTFCKHVF